jgi:hypothetical protein
MIDSITGKIPIMPKRRQAGLIVELTEGSLRIKSQEKVLTLISAQNPPDAEELTDFIVSLDDIAHWDAPHENVEINIEFLQKIVQAIEVEFDKLGLKVEFE